YVSTKDHALYKKGQLLFGMHAAARASRTLYVFEGNSDCVTASDRGLVNSVAVCGNAFGEAHFELAIKQGFKHFVFAMDSDPGGMEGTRRTVALAGKYLSNKPDIRAEILELPSDNGKMDPDLYIREKGLAARSEEHTSELQSPDHLVCRLLLEKKKKK